MNDNITKRLALLIDADNASYKLIGELISEVGKYGKVTIRRAYGDFSDDRLKTWKNELNVYAIRPMQKFAYTVGKNSTDSAMIIDAMDIMHNNLVDGFCIASSDSDYTGLALRIREEGKLVLGIGRFNTPIAFQKACEVFVFTENLLPQIIETKNAEPEVIESIEEKNTSLPVAEKIETYGAKAPRLQGLKVVGKIDLDKVISRIDKKPIDLSILERAVKMAMEENGFAYMGTIREKIKTLDPSFDVRTYGFDNLTSLFRSLNKEYELEYKNHGSTAFVKVINS